MASRKRGADCISLSGSCNFLSSKPTLQIDHSERDYDKMGAEGARESERKERIVRTHYSFSSAWFPPIRLFPPSCPHPIPSTARPLLLFVLRRREFAVHLQRLAVELAEIQVVRHIKLRLMRIA